MNDCMKENLKLLSVRLDPGTVEKIDQFVRNRRYWKRNTVVNAILTAVMNDFREDAVYDMVRRSFHSRENVDAEYKIKGVGES